METLEQYFERHDTPAKGSPVGNLIPRILEKYPELDFEQARGMAHDLLAKAAKGRVYRNAAGPFGRGTGRQYRAA